MTYKIPDQDIADYYHHGFIVFKRILPTSLIKDLRIEADKAAAIIRAQNPQAQRIQPLQAHDGKINLQPFRDFAQLPALRDAIDQLLSKDHTWGNLDVMGILLEPTQYAWCTSWHRDITAESSRLPIDEFEELVLDWKTVNQINCPLYDDECTWFVPGSHVRTFDLPGERTAAAREADLKVGWMARKEGAPDDLIQREANCDTYCKAMPGGIPLRLCAGDFALYRPFGWHLGTYLPYKKRATLHDAMFTPHYETWWRQWIKGGSPRWSKKPAPVPAPA
jgi:hypothetical protein